MTTLNIIKDVHVMQQINSKYPKYSIMLYSDTNTGASGVYSCDLALESTIGTHYYQSPKWLMEPLVDDSKLIIPDVLVRHELSEVNSTYISKCNVYGGPSRLNYNVAFQLDNVTQGQYEYECKCRLAMFHIANIYFVII